MKNYYDEENECGCFEGYDFHLEYGGSFVGWRFVISDRQSQIHMLDNHDEYMSWLDRLGEFIEETA